MNSTLLKKLKIVDFRERGHIYKERRAG